MWKFSAPIDRFPRITEAMVGQTDYQQIIPHGGLLQTFNECTETFVRKGKGIRNLFWQTMGWDLEGFMTAQRQEGSHPRPFLAVFQLIVQVFESNVIVHSPSIAPLFGRREIRNFLHKTTDLTNLPSWLITKHNPLINHPQTYKFHLVTEKNVATYRQTCHKTCLWEPNITAQESSIVGAFVWKLGWKRVTSWDEASNYGRMLDVLEFSP